MPSLRLVRNKSYCKECPYVEKKKIKGISSLQKPKIVVVGGAPGEYEDYEGFPFVGPAGRFFARAFSIAGVRFDSIYKTNVILCKPPKNDIECMESQLAIESCSKGFFDEIKELKALGVKVFIAAGVTAMTAFGIEGSVSKNRGSVFMISMREKGKVFIPIDYQDKTTIVVVQTFHPSYIMTQAKEEVTWINDLEKAIELSKKKYVPPKENFNLFPTVVGVRAFVKEAIAERKLVAVDLETTSLDAMKGEIIMIGLATNGTDGICVPFYSRGRTQYWKDADEKEVIKSLRKLFDRCPTMYQNALFDVRFLQHHGFPVSAVAHDILLLHHAIHPELPHNLEYIVSIYGKTPYWKDTLVGSVEHIFKKKDDEIRTYNMRDTVVLHQVLKDMVKEAKDDGTFEVYQNISMRLIRPIIEMIDNGVLLSKYKLKKYKEGLEVKVAELEKAIKNMVAVAPEFNFNSDHDVRYLLFGIEPSKYTRAIKELKTYEVPDCKKSKTTKKYVALLAAKTATEKTQTLYLPKNVVGRKTASGTNAVNKIALESLRIACNNRQYVIENLKKSTQRTILELKKLKQTQTFIDTYLILTKCEKLLSTYTDFPVAEDKRVHGQYKIHGTATGRLSSSKPNMQNIDNETKKVFVSPKGKLFVQGDYSNLELRIQGIESNDLVLQDQFNKGLNIHTENCKTMFGLTEEDKMWKLARHASKTYIFGRNYGGGLNGIFQRVAVQVPELNLTMSQFKKVDAAYRKAHPAYDKWKKKIIMTVSAMGKLTNQFGRTRIFLGYQYEIEKQGLNFPMQSNAADIVNTALIYLHNELVALRKKDKSYNDVLLCGTVHDSIVMEVPIEMKSEVVKLMKKHMERKFLMNEKLHAFPVDFSVGKSLGELKEIK